MSMASEIYAKRKAQRAAREPGAEQAQAPAAATEARDVLGAAMIGQSAFTSKPSKAMPDAAQVYAGRRAERAARSPGSGESEE